jgi:hypothetical protein
MSMSEMRSVVLTVETVNIFVFSALFVVVIKDLHDVDAGAVKDRSLTFRCNKQA